MGADLWIEVIGFKATDGNQIDRTWARWALAWARQAVEDNAFLSEANQLNNYPNLAEFKRVLFSDLDEVEQAAFGSHREATTVPGGGGIVLLVAGGMSGGDSPSELFESLCRLKSAGVIPDARWPKPKDACPPTNPVA